MSKERSVTVSLEMTPERYGYARPKLDLLIKQFDMTCRVEMGIGEDDNAAAAKGDK